MRASPRRPCDGSHFTELLFKTIHPFLFVCIAVLWSFSPHRATTKTQKEEPRWAVLYNSHPTELLPKLHICEGFLSKVLQVLTLQSYYQNNRIAHALKGENMFSSYRATLKTHKVTKTMRAKKAFSSYRVTLKM